MDGSRREPPVPDLPPVSAVDREGLLEPPVDLSDQAKACWRSWAPQALEERTLGPSTEPGFRELCIRMSIVQELDARIALLGVGTQDSLPYLRERRGQASQLNASLKDFKLSAFGKPAIAETPAPAAGGNEWAAFGSQK
jgi:hypothetical protein